MKQSLLQDCIGFRVTPVAAEDEKTTVKKQNKKNTKTDIAASPHSEIPTGTIYLIKPPEYPRDD